jgi:hypothetical protein
MQTAVIASQRTHSSVTNGVETAPPPCSTWLSVTLQTLWAVGRRRLCCTRSSPSGPSSRAASLYSMLVASDISRHAPSVPP